MQPDFLLSQLEIACIDSKFIESRHGLIAELLDQVLFESAIDSCATGIRGFNRRDGLCDKPVQVRFSVLDSWLAIAGLDDLSVPDEQFAELSLDVRSVDMTEHEINGLAFPERSGAIVIFGLDYGLERLARIPWLRPSHC